MTMHIAITIGIWLLMLLLLAFTKYDFGGIAMLVVALLVITGCVKPNTALAKFADSNVIIIAAMMMCAAGFSKTRAVKSIGNLLFKVSGGSFERCCGMFMVVLFAMGFVLPGAVGRIAIAYPIMMEVCRRYDRSPSKIMFPVGCMMLCDQTGFPIGGAAVTYAKYNGFLENAGYTFGDSFSIMDPFIARIPVCIIMLIYFMTIGVKIAPEKPALAIEALKVKAKKEERELTKFLPGHLPVPGVLQRDGHSPVDRSLRGRYPHVRRGRKQRERIHQRHAHQPDDAAHRRIRHE